MTRFGAFFDSVLDRYSDIIVYVGIMFFYARETAQHSTLLVALTGLALVGSVLVSYSRARAESLNIACKVGFLERPERLVLLIIGSLTQIGPPSNPFLYKMPHILWVLTALSHWTVIHRIYHTWRELKEPDRAAIEAARVKRENTQTNEKQGNEKTVDFRFRFGIPARGGARSEREQSEREQSETKEGSSLNSRTAASNQAIGATL